MQLPQLTYPDGTTVHLWLLSEDAEQLYQLGAEAGIELNDLNGLATRRRREVLATRLLLQAANGDKLLQHDDDGAPVAKGCHVSVSHTTDMVVLALNQDHAIGIDVERTDRQQVLRVRNKFLNQDELTAIANNNLQANIMAWTAKEAIIKLCRQRDIDWTNAIRLEPMPTISSLVTFRATCHQRLCNVAACSCNDHIITVAHWL